MSLLAGLEIKLGVKRRHLYSSYSFQEKLCKVFVPVCITLYHASEAEV